jgi:uncharacterized protein (DUF58 family)
MLGTFLLSGWVSMRAIRDLEVERVEEGNVFARVRGGIRVRLRDRAPGRARALEVRLDMDTAKSDPSFFPGGEGPSPLVVIHARPERRGPARIRRLELKTSFPFGFMEKSWSLPLDQEVVVLPHPLSVGLSKGPGESTHAPRMRKGASSPDGARPFLPGDALTHVHWKRTAQLGAPWVRTLEDEEPRGIRLQLDQKDWPPGKGFEKELERLSGSVLQARLHRLEASLELRTSEGTKVFQGFTSCWRALALAQAEGR